MEGSARHTVSDLGGEELGEKPMIGCRALRIRERLRGALHPVELEVEDVSYEHEGHTAVKGKENGETHFNVKVVSDEFLGKSLVKRHRLVYDLLQNEFQTGLHALSIVAKTPSELGYKQVTPGNQGELIR